MSDSKSNIIPENGYFVQILSGKTVIASKTFMNKPDAIESATRIVSSEHFVHPEANTYAMIWSGKQMVDYIDI